MEAGDDSWAVLPIEQLFGVGMTRGDIRSACRRGSLMALGGGLYLRGCRHTGDEGRRQDAAVSGETAAALRSLDGFAPGTPITLATEPSGSPGSGVRRITRLGTRPAPGKPGPHPANPAHTQPAPGKPGPHPARTRPRSPAPGHDRPEGASTTDD